jgi:hypothetical protein
MTNSAVTDRVRVYHVWLGLGAVAVFLYSGLYMRRQFPEAYAAHDAIRYLYRANHIYILFAALLNLTLGFQLSDAGRRGKGTLQMVASALVAAAVPLLVYAFFVEPPKASPERPITVLGIVCAAAGTGLHGVARWRMS